MQNIEIEYKQLLSKEEYEKLMNVFITKDFKTINQINYYFEDKDNYFKNNNQALRIRQERKDNSIIYEACLKIKRENDILERNKILSLEEFNKLLENPNLFNEIYDLNLDIKLLGYLETIRVEYHCDKGLFCLDNSYYLDKVDFEIEFEAIDYNQEEYFKAFLEEYGIKYEYEKITKIKRFMNALDKKKEVE